MRLENTLRVLALLASIFGAGLAGAVFHWYVNRPRPTTLTYNLSTVSYEADAKVKSVVPNLKLQIGNEDIGAFYTHTLDLWVSNGPPVDNVTLGITFSKALKVFGRSAQAPSGLHSISCSEMSRGLKCTLSPLNSREPNKYSVFIATDQPAVERVFTTDDRVNLSTVETFSSERAQREASMGRISVVSLAAAVLAFLLLIAYTLRRGISTRR